MSKNFNLEFTKKILSSNKSVNILDILVFPVPLKAYTKLTFIFSVDRQKKHDIIYVGIPHIINV